MKNSVAFCASFAMDLLRFAQGAKCVARAVCYWFRFPTGWPVSGHAYAEQPDGSLVCQDCGEISP